MSKAIILLAILLVSCSTQEIKLEVVRKTSDLLQCEIIFGYDEKHLYEENGILIQVGVIDTTTEQRPIKAAIVNIDKTEIVLNLKSDSIFGDRTIQNYSDGSYSLILDFVDKKNGGNSNSNVYHSICTITQRNLSSRYELVGISNPNL
jgi:hypothetical protein